jgi:hypothetical protein
MPRECVAATSLALKLLHSLTRLPYLFLQDANQTAKFNLNNALAAVYTMEAINPGLEKSQREDKFQQAVQTYRVGDRLQAGQECVPPHLRAVVCASTDALLLSSPLFP